MQTVVAFRAEVIKVRAFPVRLPSSQVYWTVLDDELRVVTEAEEFLRHLRFGRGCAESTTESYARALVLYTWWCRSRLCDPRHRPRAATCSPS